MTWASRAAGLLLGLGLLGSLGCDGSDTHPVTGKVAVAGGDIQPLAGSHVEAALTTDHRVRASGTILEDGTFTLETVQPGAVLPGAREGSYHVRIILADDDAKARRRAAAAIAPRFLQFKTSGLRLTVPVEEEVTLTVSQR
jgi:hypothetical protein